MRNRTYDLEALIIGEQEGLKVGSKVARLPKVTWNINDFHTSSDMQFPMYTPQVFQEEKKSSCVMHIVFITGDMSYT